MSPLKPLSPGNNFINDQVDHNPKTRILKAALSLFAEKGYAQTTIKDLAHKAKVGEGTIFRYFHSKEDILREIATKGWIEILTDLLTELSEMKSYKAIASMMRKRMLRFQENHDLLRVCFLEVQFHPELREIIQTDIIEKMTDVAEAFCLTAMDKGIYRQLNPKIVAHVFLGMFAIAGFANSTIIDTDASPQDLREMAEVIADIFLNGVLVKQ